jgi:hypothetical protein
VDDDLIQQIDRLVEEEHQLEHRSSQGHPLTDDDRDRLKDLEVRLDQCWDLLRQRRARRHAGQDPEEAEVRGPEVVERYQQ